MMKLAVISFIILSSVLAHAQGSNYIKVRPLFWMNQQGTISSVGLGYERLISKSLSVEFMVVKNTLDKTRVDGDRSESLLVTLEVNKYLVRNQVYDFALSFHTGAAQLEYEESKENPFWIRDKTSGIISGVSGRFKYQFSKRFGSELSAGPRYFVQLDDPVISVDQFRLSGFSFRLGFDFYFIIGR